ncbi:hypothetical protein LCGC14_2149440, partial [marine sediment metagenome]
GPIPCNIPFASFLFIFSLQVKQVTGLLNRYSKSTNIIIINKNAKNVLQEYCQKKYVPNPEYDLISQEGLDHKPLFTVEASVRVVINGKIQVEAADGIGTTKKAAEIKAAEKICDLLELNYNTQ